MQRIPVGIIPSYAGFKTVQATWLNRYSCGLYSGGFCFAYRPEHLLVRLKSSLVAVSTLYNILH